jgi:mRNA-degrading endonuclease toxin of MazEF toxin-antitoxin module
MSIEIRRGDVVLVAFPFIRTREVQRKRRPAVVIQADRYNRRRAVVILAAITSKMSNRELPCKVTVERKSEAGSRAGLRTDSVVDCQTIVTIPRDEIVQRIGTFGPAVLAQIDRALEDSLGLFRDGRGTSRRP